MLLYIYNILLLYKLRAKELSYNKFKNTFIIELITYLYYCIIFSTYLAQCGKRKTVRNIFAELSIFSIVNVLVKISVLGRY